LLKSKKSCIIAFNFRGYAAHAIGVIDVIVII